MTASLRRIEETWFLTVWLLISSWRAISLFVRTNQHFTLKQNPLRRAHLDEFVAAYKPGMPRAQRAESERWKSFSYNDIVARDKANLDITWLRDESLEDLDSLPSPDVIAREIVEDLTAALAEFEAVAVALEEQLSQPR